MARLWFNRTYATTWHLIRQLRANPAGRALHILGSHPDPASPVLAACDQTLPEPDLEPDDYVDWAVETARAHRIDVLVPRAHLGALAAARARFAAVGTRLMCPDAEVVELFDDKDAAYRAASALGLPVPPYRVVHDGAGLRDAYAELAAVADEVCMKPVRGVGGEGYRRLTTAPVDWAADLAGELRSLVRLADACRALDEAGPRAVMVMPVLDGVEVSLDVVADADGRIHAVVGRAHDTQPGRRVRTIVDDPQARELATALTQQHRVAYLSNTQVKYWRGQPYLLELNTRAAGGIFQTALAGVNLPWAALQLALGEQPEPIRPRWGARYTEIASYVEIAPSR
jgi:biotin carboxylase